MTRVAAVDADAEAIATVDVRTVRNALADAAVIANAIAMMRITISLKPFVLRATKRFILTIALILQKSSVLRASKSFLQQLIID